MTSYDSIKPLNRTHKFLKSQIQNNPEMNAIKNMKMGDYMSKKNSNQNQNQNQNKSLVAKSTSLFPNNQSMQTSPFNLNSKLVFNSFQLKKEENDYFGNFGNSTKANNLIKTENSSKLLTSSKDNLKPKSKGKQNMDGNLDQEDKNKNKSIPAYERVIKKLNIEILQLQNENQELKQKMEKNKFDYDMDFLKQDLATLNKKNASIQEENNNLKQIIKTFKKIIKSDNMLLLPDIKSNIIEKIKKYQYQKKPEEIPNNTYNQIIPTKKNLINPLFQKTFDKILSWLEELSSSDSIENLVKNILLNLSKFFPGGQASIYLANPRLKLFFSKNLVFKEIYVKEGVLEQILMRGQSQIKPAFNDLIQIANGMLRASSIVFGIPTNFNNFNNFNSANSELIKNYLNFVIQIKGDDIFSNNEHQLFKLISKSLTIIFDKLICIHENKEKEKFNLKFQNLCSIINGESNFQILSDVIQNDVPPIFNVEESRLLFLKNGNLSLILGKTSSYKERYTNSEMFYNVDIGLTGLAIKEKKLISYENMKKAYYYVPQNDNIPDILNIYNIIVCPLFGKRDELLGVMYLYNYRDLQLNNYYLDSVKNLGLIISRTIESAKIFNATTSLTAKLYHKAHNSYEQVQKKDLIASTSDIIEATLKEIEKYIAK